MNLFGKIDFFGRGINKALDRRKGLILMFAMYAVLLMLTYIYRDFRMYGDAFGYFYLSDYFITDGSFAFSNYSASFRSYLFSFILLPIRLFAGAINVNDYNVFRIVFGLIFSAFFAIFLPHAIERVFKIRINFLQRLLYLGFLLCLWGNTFMFSLSDMPAFMINIIGLYLIFKASEEKKVWLQILFMVLAGMSMGGSRLIRQIYKLGMLLAVLLIIILNLRKGRRKNLLLLLPYIVGVAIIFTPQLLVNIKNFDIYSPYAQTQLALGDRMFNRIKLGFYYSEAVGYIGVKDVIIRTVDPGRLVILNESVKGPYSYFFGSPQGSVLMNKMGVEDITSMDLYIRSIIKYPLDFIALWASRLFSGLDLNFPKIYVEELKTAGWIYSMLNYTVIFLAAKMLIAAKWFKKEVLAKTLMIAIILIPVAAACLTVIEERFMLPIHMVFYMMIAFNPQTKEFLSKNPKFNFGLLIVYIVFIILSFALSANLLALGGVSIQ